MTQIELIPGTNRDVSKSQWFTSPKLAAKLVEWAGVSSGVDMDIAGVRPLRVLEPSAGNGALVRPLVAAGAEVTSVELDDRFRSELKSCGPVRVHCADFLAIAPIDGLGMFDMCVMNPPYEDNQDVRFVQHALKFAPRVVAIVRADLWYTLQRYDTLWKSVRPTRAAFCVRRPFKGAETDFCVMELMDGRMQREFPVNVTLEWWDDKWW